MIKTTSKSKEEHLSEITILLIDDSHIMRGLQTKILHSMGLEYILCAEHGKEALTVLEKSNYKIDFILCDHNMPVMSGLEFLKTIKTIAEGTHIPVIMCSANGGKNVDKALNLGAADYITKPFTSDEFKSVILKHTYNPEKII